MNKDSIGYAIKKTIGISVLRAFELLITLVDGNQDFFDSSHFPFTKILEGHTAAIRSEYLKIVSEKHIPPFQELSSEQKKLTRDEKWKTYFLQAYGNPVEEHLNECPVTAACLNKIPSIRSALFSVLEPGKEIPPHRGPYKGVLRCHLGLIIPDEKKCGITLNGKTQHWQEGLCMVFDDTFTHEAYNHSSSVRVVLFIDFVRKLPRPLGLINEFLIKQVGKSEFITEIIENTKKDYTFKNRL